MGFAVERFDHIVLNCRDVEATAGWYERVLGVTRQRFGESQDCALLRKSEDQPATARSAGR